MNQQVIPRLLAPWLRLIGEVPGIVCLAAVITLDDYTAVTIASMANQLPRLKNGKLSRKFR